MVTERDVLMATIAEWTWVASELAKTTRLIRGGNIYYDLCARGEEVVEAKKELDKLEQTKCKFEERMIELEQSYYLSAVRLAQEIRQRRNNDYTATLNK